jgi:glutaredoxin
VPSPVSQLNCQTCHADTYAEWKESPHGNTQTAPAGELGEERAGQTAKEVISGEDAEDCIACHGPTAILANGGMNEARALEYFFTTADGKFTKDTAPAHDSDWPNITCTVCHNVPGDHPASMPTLALFNSQSGKYASVASASELCGQCHGNLRFADTDHLTYNAWTTSKHSETQADVAGELSEERAGQTAKEVVSGEDAEDCIACHAPTAVLANGGMSEEQALEYFFTTADGKFTKDTAPAHSSEWPSVACIACHDQHNPAKPAYFNSSTKEHVAMKDASELCGQCHGNLRFPDTDHLSYNIRAGTGGVGVPDQQTMPGVACTDCHMFASDVDGSNSAMFHGHSWAITVKEADGKSTTSCTRCHADKDTAKATSTINQWKSDFQSLDATAQKNVAAAAEAVKGSEDKALQSKLEEAQHNLEYAESDESGGFHNHKYLMSLLKDANDKALEILAATRK